MRPQAPIVIIGKLSSSRPDEHFEVVAELVQALGDEAEIVDGLLDADEMRRLSLTAFSVSSVTPTAVRPGMW